MAVGVKCVKLNTMAYLAGVFNSTEASLNIKHLACLTYGGSGYMWPQQPCHMCYSWLGKSINTWQVTVCLEKYNYMADDYAYIFCKQCR